MNTYTYVNGNPIGFIDPTGKLFFFNAAGGIFGATSGGVGAFINSGGDLGSTLRGAAIGGLVGSINPFGAFAGGVLSNIGGQVVGNADTCNDLTDINVELALVSGVVGSGGSALTGFLSNSRRSAFAFNAQRRFGSLSPITKGLTNSVIEGGVGGIFDRIFTPPVRNNCECSD